MQFFKKPEMRIAFIFLVTGILWIVFSDKFFLLTTDSLTVSQLSAIQTIKGTAFVVLVSLLIYFLIKRSNKELTKSNDEYLQLFDNNPNPMWIYNVDTLAFVKVNHAAIVKYGYSEKEFLSMTIRDIRPEEEWKRLSANLKITQRVLSDSGIWHHQKKSGELFSVHVTSHMLEFRSQHCRLVMASDVTERQLLEQDLLTTSTELNIVVNSITDGFFMLDTDLTIIKSNGQVKSMAELGKEDIIGRNFLDVFPSKENSYTHQQYLKALSTNQSVHFETYYEKKKSWFSVSAYPYEKGLSVFFRDVTKEKENELRIIQNEQNLNALINNTEDLIWSVDSNFRYHTFNEPYRKRYMQLFNEELWVGKLALSKVRGEEYSSQWKELYQRALNGEIFTIDLEFDMLDEGLMDACIRFNPIYDSDKKVVGVGCFLQDITERNVHQKKIEQQNKKLKNIAFITSHTVRAPLANLLGLIEAIDKTNLHDPDNLKMLDHIKTSGEDLDKVIRDIVRQTVLLQQEEIDQAS